MSILSIIALGCTIAAAILNAIANSKNREKDRAKTEQNIIEKLRAGK